MELEPKQVNLHQSILAGNGYGLRVEAYASVEYCDFWNNAGGDLIGDTFPIYTGEVLVVNNNGDPADPYMNIFMDPLFVPDAVLLGDGSPCIDAGNPDPFYNDPDGSIADIGAFPFDETSVFLTFFNVENASTQVHVAWEIQGSNENVEYLLQCEWMNSEWVISHEEISPGTFSAVDGSKELLEGGTYQYSLLGRQTSENWELLGSQSIVREKSFVPVALYDAFPNPFNPQTSISFYITFHQRVRVVVYDASGRKIAQLADDYFGAGLHNLDWNGTNLSGQSVASGTYLIVLESSGYVNSQKITLLH